jgi:two-component system, LytTR family, response regulator
MVLKFVTLYFSKRLMEKWNCIIVDDEEVDRLMIVSFAKRFPTLHISGVFKSSKEALAFLETSSVDILFLDIDMPGTNGLEFRKKALEIPVCIYITGHAEHAVESFELETLDFIVKPIKFDRFEKAMDRVEQFMDVKQKATLFEMSFGTDTVTVKEGDRQIKIKLSDILYLEALKDYTSIVTTKKKHCIWSNIGTVLKQELFQNFIRIHRSYAIQKQFIKHKTASKIILNNGVEITVGRSYKDNLDFIL